MGEIVRCGNCLAPLRLDVGPIAACAYCGAQTRLATAEVVGSPPAPSSRSLASTIAFAVTPTLSIPFLKAGSPVPIFQTETLSTSRDDQETLKVNLIDGTTPLTSFEFPIHSRGPRGTVRIALTVRVSAEGELSLTLLEPGTSNVLDRGGLAVLIR